MFSVGKVVGGLFVYIPALSDSFFVKLGIQSGVDGVFMVAITILALIVKHLHQKLIEVERKYTDLVRYIALDKNQLSNYKGK